MKNVKRVVSLLLVIVMSLGLFVGCKKEEKTANEGERVLTVGIPQNSKVADYDTNKFCEYLILTGYILQVQAAITNNN